MTLEGEYERAVELAEQEAEEHGSSTQVMVQWANAVLWLGAVEKGRVPLSTLETALRIFLTSVEEQGGAKPVGHLTRAAADSWLSGFFLSQGDQLSALTAAILALAEDAKIVEGETPLSLMKLPLFIQKELCDRVATIQSELSLSSERWLGDADSDPICPLE